MFIVVPFSDSIRIPASELGNAVEEVLTHEIDLKYANRVIAGLGLVVCTFALDKVSQSVIYPGDGGAFTTASFRLLVWRPVQDEVLVGRVKSCDKNYGIQLSLDFFDDVYIPPSAMREPPFKFDEESRSFVWHFLPEGSPPDAEPTLLPIGERATVRCVVTSVQYSDEPSLARRLDAAQTAAAAARAAAAPAGAAAAAAAGGAASTGIAVAGAAALVPPAAPAPADKPKTASEQFMELWSRTYSEKGAVGGAVPAPTPGDRDTFRPQFIVSSAPETDGANLPSWDSMASYSLVPPASMGGPPRGPAMPVQSSHAAAREALRTELLLVNSSEGAARSFGSDVRSGPTATSPMVVYASVSLDGTGCPEWWPSEEAGAGAAEGEGAEGGGAAAAAQA